MSSRIASHIFDGSSDPLPAGPVVLGGYVVIVAAALALAGVGGWFGVVAIAVVLLAAVVLIVRAGNWPAPHGETDADSSDTD
jgi:hypothetical protein